jgi:hypothetical protein
LTEANPDAKFVDQDTLTDPVLKGKSTSCAIRCPVRPVKALRFGKRADLIAKANAEITAIKNGTNPYTNQPLATSPVGNFKTAPPDLHLYGDSTAISGGSHVLFILEQKNEFYGIKDQTGLVPGRLFPAEPKYAAAKVPANWGTGVATSAALAILPFWLLFRRKQQMEAAKATQTKGGAK